MKKTTKSIIIIYLTSVFILISCGIIGRIRVVNLSYQKPYSTYYATSDCYCYNRTRILLLH